MLQPPPRPRAQLSHLVGPGPAATHGPSALSLGVCNTGDTLAAVELALELAGTDGPALVTAAWSGLVPHGTRREFSAHVDWTRRELVLAERAFAFEQRGTPQACVARARLRTSRGPEQVLEVGLRAPSGTGAR